jgi:hypothetical protein
MSRVKTILLLTFDDMACLSLFQRIPKLLEKTPNPSGQGGEQHFIFNGRRKTADELLKQGNQWHARTSQ